MRAAIAFMILVAAGCCGAAIAAEVRVQKLLGGRVEMTMPAELAPVTIQWPGGSDLLVDIFKADGGDVSVTVSAQTLEAQAFGARKSDRLDGMVTALVKFTKPAAEKWYGDGQRSINGRSYRYVEYTSRVGAESVYHYVYLTSGRKIVITIDVTCALDKLPAWKTALDDMIASTRIESTE